MGRNHQHLAARHIGQRINFVSAANSKRAASLQEKRNVRAKAGRDFQQARGGDAFSSQPKQTQEGRGGIARSATQAAAHRNAFGQIGAHAALKSNFAGKLIKGTIDEVVVAGLAGELRISGDAQIDARFPFRFQY
jgi:hypothetical protein